MQKEEIIAKLDRARRDCLMGMKALQNITGCHMGLQQLEQSLIQNTEATLLGIKTN